MPLVDGDTLETAPRVPLGVPEPVRKPENPDALAAAAFRTGSPIGAALATPYDFADRPDPSYDPLPEITGSRYLRDYGDRFVGSQSSAETARIKASIDQKEADDRLLAESGAAGTIFQLGAGMIDPTIVIPFGVVARNVRGAVSVGRSTAMAAAGGAVQGAANAGLMRTFSPGYSDEEAAMTIASSTILSGLIGSAASALLSGAERRVLARTLQADREFLAGQAPPARARGLVMEAPSAALAPEWRADPSWRTEPLVAAPAEIRAVLPDVEVQIAPTTGRLVQVDAQTGARTPLVLASDAGAALEDGVRVLDLDPIVPFEVRTLDDALAAVDHIEPRVRPDPAMPDGVTGRASTPDANPSPVGGGEAANTNTPGLAASAGAAAADTRAATLTSFGINRIPGFGRAFSRVDPVSRLFASPITTARRTLADLAEVALETVDNTVAGGFRATARGGIGPAESEIKLARNQLGLAHVMMLDDAWKRYRFGGADAAPVFARGRAQVEAFRAEAGSDRKLTFNEFDEQVGVAMMAGDRHEIPEVAEAAKWTRENVFKPWFDRAKQTEYYAALKDVESGEDYFHRVFNAEHLKEHQAEFIRDTARWYETEQTRQQEVQQRVEYLDATRRTIIDDGRKLRAKLERIEGRLSDLQSRTAERGMEANRTQRRADAVEDRLGDQAAEISELAEFAAEMRARATDPGMREELIGLEAAVSDLRLAERRTRLSPADLERAETQELTERFLATDDDKLFSDMVVGRRKVPKDPNFVSFLIENGGINDMGGEVRAMAGARPRPGLINPQGRTIDSVGEMLMDRFPTVFPERPSAIDVERMIDGAIRGQAPSWFAREVMDDATFRAWEIGKTAADYRAEMGRLGYDTNSRVDVARFRRDMADPEPAGEERFLDDPGVPASVALEGAEGAVTAAQDVIAGYRGLVAQARARQGRVAVAIRANRVRLAEARSADFANYDRMDVLAERTAIAERKRELLQDMIRTSERIHDRVLKDIEDQVRAWGGNRAAEAVSALKSREKLEAKRLAAAEAEGRPTPGRLGSADDAVQTAVRRILGADKQLSRDELEDRARETLDRILGSPDGRLPYDDASPAAGPGGGQPARGALHSRNFNIPNDIIAPYIEKSSERVVKKYLRQTVPDVVLAERFGDPQMTERMRSIQEEAAAQVAQRRPDGTPVLTPEEQARVTDESRENIRDIAAIRDRINGTFVLQGANGMRNAARVGAAVRNFNSIVDLGTSTLSSIPDLAGAVFRWGFGNVLGGAYAPWLKGLAGQSTAFREAKEQFRDMGIGVEMALATRASALDEMSDMWRPTSRLERGLEAVTSKFQVLNLQAPWTDFTKTVASIASSSAILRAAEAVRLGKATNRQLSDLAASNIEASMALRIRDQFEAAGGRVIDGVHLPDTAKWTDREARQAFEQAVAREANIAVVTPGQEKPLWLSRPLLGLFGQHKSFVFASTQRIMQANLQRADANTLAGLVTAISAGQMSAFLYSLAADKPLPGTPSEWMKEGISRSGIMGWLDDANTIAAKSTRGQADIYRLIGADKPLSKFSAVSITDMLAGPTAGKVDALKNVLGAPFSEEGWRASDTASARRLIPAQNVFFIRRMFNEIEDSLNRGIGVEPLERGMEPRAAD